MDVEQDQAFQIFLKELASKITKKNPEGFEKWQLSAWKKFLTLNLPDKNNEAFRYVRFQELYNRHYKLTEKIEDESSLKLPLESRYRIIFVDGQFNSSLSALPKGCLALPLSKAFSTFGPLLNSHFEKWIEREKNPFVHLNLASAEGVFFYIPPKLHVESPVQCIQMHTHKESAHYTATRLHLFMGRESSLEIMESSQEDNAPLFENCVYDISLEEGASLKIRRLSSDKSSQNWSHFTMRALLKRDSRLHSAALCQGGLLKREDYYVALAGENCEVDLIGGWFLNGSEQCHTHVLVEHQEPNCRSLQTFKGVLNDKAKSSFEGKIYVHEKAQKTAAYQMNKNLLLSNLTQAFSKPNLEIFADDVKASHGSTMGQLNEEELFYLKSRGIPLEKATSLLIRGFVQEVLEPFKSVDSHISPKIKGL